MNHDTQYLDLIEHVLSNGSMSPSRAGRTMRVFASSISFNMQEGFPLLRLRKMYPQPVLAELECFIRGTSVLSDFIEAGCNYWTANAQAWSPGGNSVGRIYGVQWRRWNTPRGYLDQLVRLIEGLRDDPYSRRHILTSWNPGELDDMCLPPCHMMAQFGMEGNFLSCVVTMRSVDLCLGLPADMILYGALLHLVAAEVGLEPGSLVFNFGDTHIYENHLLNARLLLEREVPKEKARFEFDAVAGLFKFRNKKASIAFAAKVEPLQFDFNV